MGLAAAQSTRPWRGALGFSGLRLSLVAAGTRPRREICGSSLVGAPPRREISVPRLIPGVSGALVQSGEKICPAYVNSRCAGSVDQVFLCVLCVTHAKLRRRYKVGRVISARG